MSSEVKPVAPGLTTMRECDNPEGASAGQLWNVRDVAHYLRLPVNSVYKMTGPKASCRIPHIRLRRRLLRFRKSDIDRWLTLMSAPSLVAFDRMRARVLRGGEHGDHSRKEAA
jgi:excisionase family DNA binding protein